MKNVTILGTGSWGTALAVLLYGNGHNVTLWSFSDREAQNLLHDRENKEFLPDVPISDAINITTSKEEATKSEFIVTAVPSTYVRATMSSFSHLLNEKHTIINVSKGFDNETQKRLSEIIEEFAPHSNVAVLSGPSHAEEVAKGLPTTCVAASKNSVVAESVQDLFMGTFFRVYTNTDIVGVELGGALKNVIALVAGITDGMGYGDNAKAALMTRGMAEMARLGVAMGAKPETFSGLSGIGDLIVTCTSMHSRNRRAGILIGQGKTVDEATKEVHMVVEGISAAKSAYALSKKYDVDMPITTEVYNVLFGDCDIKQAVFNLMGRDKKNEQATNYFFG